MKFIQPSPQNYGVHFCDSFHFLNSACIHVFFFVAVVVCVCNSPPPSSFAGTVYLFALIVCEKQKKKHCKLYRCGQANEADFLPRPNVADVCVYENVEMHMCVYTSVCSGFTLLDCLLCILDHAEHMCGNFCCCGCCCFGHSCSMYTN